MDDLLSAFDPLHSSKQPLFQQTPSPSTSASTAAASSSGLARQQQQRQQPHHAFINPHQQPPRLAQAAPVSAKDAPLLLDDTHDDPLWSSSSASRGDLLSHPGFSVQQRAEARQRDILSELETADQIQHLAQQQASQPAHSRADSAAAAGIVPGHQRPGRHSGFSPPRRMSRSGLMRDDEHHPPSSQQQYHSTHSHYHHHAHGMAGPSLTDSIPSSGAGSSETGGSSNISLVNPLAHASLSPSGLSTEPSELFHPSSPPSGSTLEAVRRQSDHFRALGVPVGAHAAPNSLPIDLMSLQDSDAQHHPPRRRDTELDRTAASALNGSGSNPTLTPASSEATASKRTAAIQSAFAIAPPPRADAAAAGNGTADHTTPTSLSASPKSLASGNLGGGGPSSSSWTTKFKPKIARKLPSFDFPTTFAHMHDEPPSYPSSGSHSPSKARSQRTSPAASLLIDTEPLAPVQRVVPPPARASRRILTEDVTEGVSVYRTVTLCRCDCTHGTQSRCCDGLIFFFRNADSSGLAISDQALQDVDSALLPR